jgi:ubiquinone/menaquinone biosynthesis C-methylase UbiE
MRSACEKYHDHVANIYDDIYSRSPYWDFYFDLSWRHMKSHLPQDLSVPVHDVGCGTGIFGIRLLKAGFRVCFSDLSARMLDVARRKVDEAGYLDRAEFIKLDMADMSPIPDGRFGFLCAQGDPLSLCTDAKKALQEVKRTLAPGGTAVLSVDNHATGYEYFLEKGDMKGLSAFHKTGVLQWLAEDKKERFPFQTFTPRTLRKLIRAAGLEVVSLIGKTVLPLRKHAGLLEDPRSYKSLMAIERKLGASEENLGRAAHLQVVVKYRDR